MREAAAHPRKILSSPPPNVLILSFSETAIELEVRFWIADARNGVHNVKSEVLYEVWKLFRQEGIQNSLPQAGFVCPFQRRRLRPIACSPLLADPSVTVTDNPTKVGGANDDGHSNRRLYEA